MNISTLDNVKMNTVDQTEVITFDNMTSFWWDELGPMKALHTLNAKRIPFIKNGLYRTNVIYNEQYNGTLPFENLQILDVGCGGGILSEPLAKLGANVTAIDATEQMINIAKEHAKNDKNLNKLTYHCEAIEEHLKENFEKYDAVVVSEVIEHISEKVAFLDNCVKCLKPNGSIFITTFNKTFLSKVGGIFFAEKILNIIPRGTHEWDKFISPHKLETILAKYKCKTNAIRGMAYNFITGKWYWSPLLSINYALHAVKSNLY